MKFLWGFIISSFVMSSVAFATEIVAFGETPRTTGMGGVHILSGDGSDANVLFWNPAGLSYISGIRFTFFNMNFGVNGLSNAQRLQDVGNQTGFAALDPFYGLPVWIGGFGYTAIAVPHIGFGVYDQAYAQFLLHNPAFPELQVTYINDYAYSLGGSLDFGPVAVGAAVKRVVRAGGPVVIGADVLNSLDASTLENYFNNEGVGYGVDLGVMYRAPMPLSPTLSLAWTDVGKTNFYQTKGATPVPMADDNLTLGANISTHSFLGGFSAGLEYRNITDANEQLGKKLFLGTEINLPLVDLRAGFYQGYPTYGVGLSLFLFQLDASLYTVETGAYPGQTPDQRIQIGISTTMSFDPNFNLSEIGSGGKKRKLKERR